MKTKRLSFPSFIYMIFLILLMYPALKAVNSGDYFEIKRIEIEGNQKFINVLEKFKGRDLRKLDENDVIKELKKDSMVRKVMVKKVFPHTLMVKIVERKPVACYVSRDGSYVLDEDGTAFLKGCIKDLVVLTPSEVPLKFQLDFIKNKNYLAEETAWVNFMSPFSVKLKLKSVNATVMLPVKNFEEKYKAAKDLLPILSNTYVFSYADFRVGNKIYLGRKK